MFVSLLLLLLPLRWLVQYLLGAQKAYSVWCGAPILTLALKARAERQLGTRSISLVRDTYYITNQFDIVLSNWFKSRVSRYVGNWLALAWVYLFSKRVHTFYDGGVLTGIARFQFHPYELFLYRVSQIEHFAWAYGADVRVQSITRELGEPNCCSECDDPGKYCICDGSKSNENLNNIRRGAQAMFAMGDMVAYVPKARTDLFYWPIDIANDDIPVEEVDKHSHQHQNKPLKLVHAPNHRLFKGTHLIVDAVAQLKAEGVLIELTLVEGLSNSEALTIYQGADLIIDQVLIGFHGYFALEAMALGKPVMCFIRNRDNLLQSQDCPIIEVTVDTLITTLKYWANEDRHLLKVRGAASRLYVHKWYSVEAFSSRLQHTYQELGIKA